MVHFQLDDCMKRSEELLKATRKIFEEYKDLSLKTDALPETMQPSDGKIKLVFIGQYSAGKSSIIKMLSGIDTVIGANVATQEAHNYSWGDLEIVDTPGIHTELHPDHDEKTYYQIDHAALLIFVVTNEGFDDRMGNHFRKLAIEQKRAKNMVLVVNKMDRAAMGNTLEQQEIIANDMKKVIEPYTPEALYLSFLSTDKYFEGQEAEDEDEKAIYMQDSGYEPFVENLNAFVKSRGLLSKIQAPLETLKSAITAVIGEADNLMTDKDIDAKEEIYRRQQRTLLDGKGKIRTQIEELANTCATQICEEGSKAASVIAPGVTEEEVAHAIEAAQNQSQIFIENCDAKMRSRLADICGEVEKEILTEEQSILAMDVRASLSEKGLAVVGEETSEENGKSTGEMLASLQVSKGLIGMTAKEAGKLTASGLGGSLLADIPLLGDLNLSAAIKEVGSFFGFKFAPWGAANIVKGASKVLGWVGIALTAFQLLDKLAGGNDKKVQDNLNRAQEEIRQQFNAAAEEMRVKMIKAATDRMDELTAPKLQEAEEHLAGFQSKKERIKEVNRALTEILGKVDVLMDEVQATAKA